MEKPCLIMPHKAVLSNGVPVYIIKGGTQDVLRIDLLVRGGYSIQERPLQALFTNRMLREGTSDYKAEEISRLLDYYGAWIEMYSLQECNRITLYTLGRYLEPMLNMLESMVKRPLFPSENLETIRANNKAFYHINSRKVDVVAQRHFEKAIWGENHPLGHIVCAEDYDAITEELLRKYHSLYYGSQSMAFFISGNVDDKCVAAIEKRFGDIWGSNENIDFAVAPPVSVPGASKVKIDGVLQSGIRVGRMVMDTSHPDFHRFRFLTVILGGYFGSRLMSNIRERNGYTYHIEAEIDAYGSRNAFMISTETDNEYVEPLLAEVDKELKRLRDEYVPKEELELVRNYTLGELCREYEGVLPKAEVFISLWLSGQPFEAVNDYLDTVCSVSQTELRSLAQEYLSPEQMSQIVVGE
ncbi:MAG: insulinase family protein [Bacteroidaceae bacterium]|nr:insulinase family protein [Bacteroidaceae bacterium]